MALPRFINCTGSSGKGRSGAPSFVAAVNQLEGTELPLLLAGGLPLSKTMAITAAIAMVAQRVKRATDMVRGGTLSVWRLFLLIWEKSRGKIGANVRLVQSPLYK